MITLDFETYWDDKYSLKGRTMAEYIRDKRFKVHMVGIKKDDQPTVVLNTSQAKEHFARNKEKYSQTIVVAHNAPFDGLILSEVYGVKPNMLLCTRAMAYGAFGPNLTSYSLDALATRILGKEKIQGTLIQSKGVKELDDSLFHLMGEYCIQDVDLTYELFNFLKPSIPKDEFRVIDITNKMTTEPALEIDVEMLGTFLPLLKEQRANAMADSGVNLAALRSDKLLAKELEKRGVKPPMKISPTTGKEIYAFAKTDAAFLELKEHPVVGAIVCARLGLRTSIEETRTETFIRVGKTGLVPVSLNYCGAHTGRWSAYSGEAMNFQNLPKKSKAVGGVHPLRKAIRAPAGKKLIVADSSQIEARIVAALAGEEALVSAFAEGRDVYCEFGTEVFSKPITKANELERFVAKGVVLGCGYGMGGVKLACNMHAGVTGKAVTFDDEFLDKLGVSKQTYIDRNNFVKRALDNRPPAVDESAWITHCAAGEALVSKYRTTYSKIPELWSTLDSLIRDALLDGEPHEIWDVGLGGVPFEFSQGKIKLPSGRFLTYPNLRKDEQGKYIYNGKQFPKKGAEIKFLWGGTLTENICQALARDIIAYQKVKAAKKYKVAASTHDEMIVVVDEPIVEEAFSDILTIMKKGKPKWAKGIPLDAEGSWADNYGDAK